MGFASSFRERIKTAHNSISSPLTGTYRQLSTPGLNMAESFHFLVLNLLMTSQSERVSQFPRRMSSPKHGQSKITGIRHGQQDVVKYINGRKLAGPNSVEVPELQAGETTQVSVNMMSPEETGLYESRWSLVTERGAHFGDTIWCIIPVEEGGTLAVTQMIERL